MDALKRARRPMRNELKKIFEDIGTLMKGPHDKDVLRVHYTLMMDTYTSLSEIDRKIADQLVIDEATEEAQDEEYDKVREIRINVETLRTKLEKLLETQAAPSDNTDSSTSVALDGDGTGLRLPKYQFKKFSGKLLDWLAFWAQFQKVDLHPKLSGSDKFSYLLMSLEEGTEAYDLVNAFPQSNENYVEAVDALKRRYGNEDLLLQVYIRELLKLVISNVNSKEKLPFPSLYTKVDSHLRSLKTLNLASADPATWLYPLVESCLPDDILLTWQRSPTSTVDSSDTGQTKTRLDQLMEFLGKEVDIRQRMGIAREGFENTEKSQGQNKRKHQEASEKITYGKKAKRSDLPTLTGFQNVDSSTTSCLFCQRRGHRTEDCISAKKLSFEERKKIAVTNKLCFNCLGKHLARSCRSNLRCLICSGRHCNAMCKRLGSLSTPKKDDFALSTDGNKQTQQESSKNQMVQFQGNSTHNFSNQVKSSHISLQTLQVFIRNGSHKMKARVFLDSGSQRSYILRSVAAFLCLEGKGTEIVDHELFGGNRIGTIVHQKYDVTLVSLNGEYQCQLQVRDQNKISNSIPMFPMSNQRLINELSRMGIELSDVGDEKLPIDILIGADYYGSLLTGNIINVGGRQVAVETKLGWTLIGGDTTEVFHERSSMSMSVTDCSITQLWDLGIIGIQDSTQVKSIAEEELEAKNRFMQNITRNQAGRYVVKLPWKECHPTLPSNKNVALKRLERTTKKLKESGLYEVYGALFLEWEKEDFIEEVNEESNSEKLHYIPHRAVIKTSSMTTPVRPVFDASCKVGKSPSLNDCLYKGTNFIRLIPDILYRFRERKIGITSDIRKAFQMIEVDEADRDSMRFLWWKNDTDLKIYRHKRVMFGANCSPFILGAVLDFHLTNLESHQLVGQKLLNSMYVDNSVSSEDTLEEYQHFRAVSTKLLSDCGMELRMWLTNVDEFDNPATHVVSVLGLMWDRISDELFVKVEDVCPPETVTKRSVLSSTQKVFDPIGLTCPAIIPLKGLLQRTWINKLKWDDPLPLEECKFFLKTLEELPVLSKIRIPRWMINMDSKEIKLSLHTFTDSSMIGYSCVTYLRITDGDKVCLQLLSARARVAPVKPLTIPRLELLGCLIGARQCNSLKSSLSLKEVPETYWTDSSTALAWIKRNDAWGTFVGNRTKEINELTRKEDWRHVPGNINPADLPSRGCTPSFLLDSKWWLGPSWLYETEDLLEADVVVNEEEVQKERRKNVTSNERSVTMTVLSENKKERSFWSMIRIVGWMKRFVHNCKASTKLSGGLSTEELCAAEIALIYGIQQDECLDGDMDRFRGLEVFKNSRGLLCVKTRVVRRDDLFESNTPVILPGKHPIVKRMIWDYHRAYCHAGVGFLLTKLRQKYWILKARKSVKHVVSKCFRCRRLSSKHAVTEASPLPLDRIKDAEVFEVVGVDLAGPLVLRGGKKVWLVVITCAVYRAVYLDIVSSLSTKAFIKCLERFINKFRRPDIVYSDNGTNFRGADNFFKTLNWEAIQQKENIKPITWKFNPPGGPWWGGFWERIIRTVKDLLRRSVGKASLTWKELSETLKIIQEVLNDRPLTYVTENTDDLEPLTPNMFLKPRAVCKFPEAKLSEAEKLRIRHKYMQTLWEELKQRFRREYLSLLVSRYHKKPTRPLKEGELVVVGSEQRKRWEWPLGRIIKLMPGGDGVVRVAKVKMADGELIRPVQRLHPLELDSESVVGHHMKTRSKCNV